MTTRAVVGLLFDEAGDELLLLRKARPAWQAGYLNGPGGKLEDGESPAQAMTREFLEETGLRVEDWREVCVRRDQDTEVYFFASTGNLRDCRASTDEVIEIVRVSEITRLKVVYNLRWIVPLALDRDLGTVIVSTP